MRCDLPNKNALALILVEVRTRAGLTQQQLARCLRTSQSVIARLEGGRVSPTTHTLEKIAKATGSHLKVSFEPDMQLLGG